jgi:hypothetical protein
MSYRPRRAKVKLTRTVTEIAIVLMDREGFVEEIEEVHEELDFDVEIHDIRSILSVHP